MRYELSPKTEGQLEICKLLRLKTIAVNSHVHHPYVGETDRVVWVLSFQAA